MSLRKIDENMIDDKFTKKVKDVEDKAVELTQQLAETKQESNRKRELEDLSPTVLAAIQGSPSGEKYNLLSIPQNGSVSPTKTTFAEVGKNKINKKKFIKGFTINHTNGEVIVSPDYLISDYWGVSKNTEYTQSSSVVVAFYDAEKVFISALPQVTPLVTRSFTTPDNAEYARTVATSENRLNSYQLEVGNTATAYEDYKIKITDLELPSITVGEGNLTDDLLEKVNTFDSLLTEENEEWSVQL